MKASMLGLALSTVAFGASSIYLWQQLDAARSQYAAVVAASKTLSARIAELEKSRAEFAGQRFADQGRFGGGMMAQGGLGPAQAPPPPAGEDEPASNTARFDASVKRPEMPPAMLKMMRSQMRAQNKRTYFDLRESLGLSDEQSDKLIDLITEQQTAGFNATRNLDPEQARAQWEAVREKQKAEITDLLGPTKAAQFEDYQKSMPARMELQALSQQFESSTAPLSDDQRKRMLTAYIEERDRIPAPTYSENTPQEEMTKAYSEWQADYDERIADMRQAAAELREALARIRLAEEHSATVPKPE